MGAASKTRVVALTTQKGGLSGLSFLATLLNFNAYFVWKVGLRQFCYHTAVFVIKYFPADRFSNWRAYLAYWPSVHLWPNWPDLTAWFFIQALIPLVYVLFFVRYWQEARLLPEKPWERLMLVNVTGVFMFLSVAPSPSYVRLYCVSLPGLIILSWFLDSPFKAERALQRAAWTAALALGLVRPAIAQMRSRTCLDLPTGRTAFLDPALSEKCRWLSERTRPSEYFFGDPFLCFALRLRDPARVSFVRPTDYTRPEEVHDLVQVLEERRVRFVNWYNGLDSSDLPGDHLAPLRLYLDAHYHVAKTFANLDQIWERNKCHLQSSHSCPSADGHPETMKMNRPLTPTPLPLFPLPWGEGRGERGDRVRGVFRTRHFQSSKTFNNGEPVCERQEARR